MKSGCLVDVPLDFPMVFPMDCPMKSSMIQSWDRGGALAIHPRHGGWPLRGAAVERDVSPGHIL